jgi:hypothetical protein
MNESIDRPWSHSSRLPNNNTGRRFLSPLMHILPQFPRPRTIQDSGSLLRMGATLAVRLRTIWGHSRLLFPICRNILHILLIETIQEQVALFLA